MAAAVMGDRPIAVRREEEHLVFKRITAEWPTVTEDNRLSRTPILVVNLRAVFGCDRAHGASSFARVRKGRGVRLLGDHSHRRSRSACIRHIGRAADRASTC